MSPTPPWWTVSNISEVDSPALLVYPDRVQQNIEAAIRMTEGPDRLRPHIKTNKSPDACAMMLRAGITKFKCATIAEAEMLGRLKAPDVLLAYPALGPKAVRLGRLMQQYPGTLWSCLVDNHASAENLNDHFKSIDLQLRVYVDINVGMNRTGIAAGEAAANLYRHCDSLSNINPAGLHAYDGHIRDADFNERTRKADEAFATVTETAARITQAGFPAPVIIAGGSPSFPIHARRQKSECSPGTFVFWDKGYADLCPEQPFVPACVLLTRIISLPAPGVLCADLGHKSVAAENEIGRRIFLLNAPGLTVTSQSEEHLVLSGPGNHAYQPGQVIYGLPYHICPTVALYDQLITVHDGRADGSWPVVARNRSLAV